MSEHPSQDIGGHGVRTPPEHRSALAALLRAADRGPREERVPLERAAGRVLARDVIAPHDSPRFDNSQMDGYALAETDVVADGSGTGAATYLVGEIGDFRAGPVLPAGTRAAELYPDGLTVAGTAVPIMTGAQLPAGTGGVVPVERCDPSAFVEPGETVRIPRPARGTFLRPAGSDLRRGARLLPGGRPLTPQALALAASQGIAELPVLAGPRVLVCTGGDEIAGEAGDVLPGEGEGGLPVIPDANGPLLETLLRRCGAVPVGRVRTTDDPAALADLLSAALAEHRPDLVIASGGISHGKFEVVRQVVGAQPGNGPSAPWFGHVAQQPGGPQGHGAVDGVPVLCLPGNPVSTLVSFRVLVEPVLAEVFGAAPAPQTLRARLVAPVAGVTGKIQYRRAILSLAPDDAGAMGLVVELVGGPGSHLLAQALPATALLAVPPGAELGAGAVVEVLPLADTGLPLSRV